MAPAPAVAGGATALPTSSFPDLVRLVLSLSGSMEQRDAVRGSLLSTAAVTGAGSVPAPAAPVPTAATIVCSPLVPTLSGSTSAGAASATASHGRCEHAQESSCPERRHGRLTGRERSLSGGKRGKRVGLLPLLALPVRPVLLPPPPLGPRARKGGLVHCLLPPPVVLVQAVVALGVPAQRLVAPASPAQSLGAELG